MVKEMVEVQGRCLAGGSRGRSPLEAVGFQGFQVAGRMLLAGAPGTELRQRPYEFYSVNF